MHLNTAMRRRELLCADTRMPVGLPRLAGQVAVAMAVWSQGVRIGAIDLPFALFGGQPGALALLLCGEEGVGRALEDLRPDAGAVVLEDQPHPPLLGHAR